MSDQNQPPEVRGYGLRAQDFNGHVPQPTPAEADAIVQAAYRQARAEKPIKQSKDRAVYTRQQRGHSLILNLLLIGPLTLWITTVYYTVSPNHYWHA